MTSDHNTPSSPTGTAPNGTQVLKVEEALTSSIPPQPQRSLSSAPQTGILDSVPAKAPTLADGARRKGGRPRSTPARPPHVPSRLRGSSSSDIAELIGSLKRNVTEAALSVPAPL